MSDCCSPRGYRWLFSERRAQAEAKRYRRRGLDPTSRRIVEIAKEQTLEGRTLLEIGGGIGAIQIELLRAGISRAVCIELTPTFEAADIVIMNRVLCCYPDMPALAGAAADHTRDVLLLSFPKERWWTRLVLSTGNWLLRVTRRQFHVFLHSPEAIMATGERHGLRTTLNEPGLFWQVIALRRGPR